MKLIKLKLLSEFRGLKKGFEVVFDDTKEYDSHVLEPICFVGLNGSGKSNILEVISEIFYYLENYSKSKASNVEKFATLFGFEIEYILSSEIYNQFLIKNQPSSGGPFVHIRITKKINKTPIAYAKFKHLQYIVDGKDRHYVNRKYKNDIPEGMPSFLPTKIIGYSSGMNELLSNPFLKIDFEYLADFNKLIREDSVGSLDVNRMFFMDYDLNKLITICNFLFDENVDASKHNLGVKNIEPLKREIGIKALHSFSISIRLRHIDDKNPIKLPSELNIVVDQLEKCATYSRVVLKETKKGKYTEYYLSFWVNREMKKAFKHHFGSAYRLFRGLYFLRLLNTYLIGVDTQREVKNADIGTNISAMLPKYEARKRLFHISDITLKKRGVKKPVYYRQLSDGEHQFLHVIGAMILLDSYGILFLLDEPETHFNPEWRSQFVSILNECMETKDRRREQEVLLTTHSPFIVSDCRKEKVFIFKKKGKDNKIKPPKNPDFETFGTSIEMIYWNIFGKHETISQMALTELNKIKVKIENNQIGRKEAIKSLLKFGNSMERMKIVELLKKKGS